jgi:hypothetical protein
MELKKLLLGSAFVSLLNTLPAMALEGKATGNHTSLITPDLQKGQELFSQFSFAQFCYDILNLLNFVFYYGSILATLLVGLYALYHVALKKDKSVGDLAKDLGHLNKFQAIIMVIVCVKLVSSIVDFFFYN